MTREEQTKREAEVYGWTGSQFDFKLRLLEVLIGQMRRC